MPEKIEIGVYGWVTKYPYRIAICLLRGILKSFMTLQHILKTSMVLGKFQGKRTTYFHKS